MQFMVILGVAPRQLENTAFGTETSQVANNIAHSKNSVDYLVVIKPRMSCRHCVMVSTLPPLLQTPSPSLKTPFPSAVCPIPGGRCCSDGEALMPSPLSSDLSVG